MTDSPPIPENSTGARTDASFQTIRPARLRVGSRLKFPVFDNHDVLLLAAGQTITTAFLDLLQQRGVLLIKVHQSELPGACAGEPQGAAKTAVPSREGTLCPLGNAGTKQLDAIIGSGHLDFPPQGDVFANRFEMHGAVAYDEQVKGLFIERHTAGIAIVSQVFTLLSEGYGLNLDTLTAVADDALTSLIQDSDLFTSLGINPLADEYPARHSLHVCMLALVIGARLQLDRLTLKELAIGCLIHDAGMLKIDPAIYRAPKVLNPVEFLEITNHPILIFEMIKNIRAISHRAAMIAYQMHERCNGTGYPRRRKSAQIHPLAKIASVADAYVGLVSPRPHRPALRPYFAMKIMLQGVRDGLFDPAAVRALVQSASLFPLGSFVQLNDGRVGRVIRTNRDSYIAPILEVWRVDSQHETPEIINLLESSEQIVGTLATLSPTA